MTGTPLSFVLRQFHRMVGAAPVEGTADGRLLERFVGQRDEAAFTALLGRHGAMVLGVCRRLLREHDAEDAFQATFLILARRAHTLKRRASVGAWLYRVAYHVALRCRQGEARRQALQPPTLPMALPDPAAEASRGELRALLDEELQRLPEKYRAPLVLCYLEGATYTEAARALGWAEGTVSGRLARARGLLRRRLERRGLAVGEAALLTALGEGAAIASVPPALATAAVRAAAQVIGGVAPAVGLPVTALADAASKGLFAGRLATPVLLGLALAVLTAGGGITLLGRGANGRGSAAGEQAPAAAEPGKPPTPAKGEPPAGPAVAEGRADLYGDTLPPGAVARLGTLRLRGKRPTSSVLLSHDGKVLAWWGQTGGAVRLSDARTGRDLRALETGSDVVLAARFREDGRSLTVISASTTVLRGWIFGDEKRLLWTLDHDSNVVSAALGPDGQDLAVATHDGWVRLRRTATGQEMKKWKGFEANRTALAFSPDGRRLAAGSGPALVGGHKQGAGVVRLWEVGTGRPLGELQDAEPVASLAFAPDGKTLAVGYLPDGLANWDLTTLKSVKSARCPLGNVPAFSPDGKLLAVGGENEVERFRLPRMERLPSLSTLGPVLGLTFSADNKTLAAGAGVYGQGNVHVWDADSGKELLSPPRHSQAITAVAFTPDGKHVVSASKDQTVRLWDADSGKALYQLREPAEGAPAFAVVAGGRALATGSGKTVRLWAGATGKQTGGFDVQGEVHALIPLPPLGQSLAVVYREPSRPDHPPWYGLTERQPETGQALQEMTRLAQGLRDVAILPDGPWVAVVGADAAAVRVWNRRLGRVEWTLTAGDGKPGQGAAPEKAPPFLRLAVAPRDRALTAVAADGTVRSWELSAGRQVRRFKTPCRPTALAVAPGGALVAVAGDADGEGAVVCVHEAAGGKLLGRLRGHRAEVLAVAFAPDGKRLATGSADTTVLVWDVADLRPGAAPEKEGPKGKEALTRFSAELEGAWEALVLPDAAKAYMGLQQLAKAPREAVALVRQRLQPAGPVKPERVAALLKDLDSDKAEVERRTAGELEVLGEAVLPSLRRALAHKPGDRLGERLEGVLCKIDGPREGGAALRALRAVELLELIGTPEARQALEALARGAPGALLTREAEAALKRLDTPMRDP
jgi:RNA polymerase sigma factor (sigma-70 family)